MPRLRPRRPVAKGPTLREQAGSYVSPNIGGEQPTGDMFGAYNSGSTMDQIRRNEWLNTLDEPTKMRAMNNMGYWTGGVRSKATQGFNPGGEYIRGVDLKPGEMSNVETGGVFQGQIVNEGQGNVWNPIQQGSPKPGVAGKLRPNPFGKARGPGGPIDGAGGAGGHFGGGIPAGRPHQGQPHNQIGQQGAGKGAPQGGPSFGGGGGKVTPKPKGGFGPPAGGGVGAAIAKPGAFPAAPPQVPNFLPPTPGYEAAYRGANDQLAGAEGAYAASGAMLPAQIAQQQARLGTDQDVATDRLREQLAERGIYTPYGAGSTAANPQMATSPGGGGVGESLYGRQVATPFGRARQDLGSSAAEAYQGRALDYGGAQLGFNQQMFDALLGRADDAYSAMPLSLPIGGYELPEMAGPSFSNPPPKTGGGGGKGPGKNRNRNGNRGRGKGRGGRK